MELALDLFGAAAVALQYLLEQAACLDAMMQTTNLAVSGVVLALGGGAMLVWLA